MTVDVGKFVHHDHGIIPAIKRQVIIFLKGVTKDAPRLLIGQDVFHSPWGPHCFHIPAIFPLFQFHESVWPSDNLFHIVNKVGTARN
jgi:hypothetical protein